MVGFVLHNYLQLLYYYIKQIKDLFKIFVFFKSLFLIKYILFPIFQPEVRKLTSAGTVRSHHSHTVGVLLYNNFN